MSDFYFLENLAIQIQENRKKLEILEAQLSEINIKLHEIPLHRATESTFAKLTGSPYEDKFSELEKTKAELEDMRQKIEKLIENQLENFLTEITSPSIVIPIDTNFTLNDGKIIYKFHKGFKFENLFKILSELLGISLPLVIKDVMLSATEIVISEKDEFDAKKKFINTFSEIQNTLLIKKRI